MTFEILCDAINKNDFETVQRLIQENGDFLNLNAVDPKTNLRPIDLAARQCNKKMLILLVSHGASLSRSPSHRDQKIENIVIQAACSRTDLRDEIYNWLLEPKQLLLLQDEGIKSEHLSAILNKIATLEDNIFIEDKDGLLPWHYNTLAESLNNPHFSSWFPTERKDTFLNMPLKGFYEGATGAWWLSTRRVGIDILQQNFVDLINTIDLYAEPVNKLNRKCGKVLNQLLKYASGKQLVNSLPDEIFFNINWNTSSLCVTAAYQLAAGLSKDFSRLFKLPLDKLAQIDWNASPSFVKELEGITLTLKIGTLDIGKVLLRSLPSNVINSIDWTVMTSKIEKLDKSKSLIDLVTAKIEYNDLVLISNDTNEFKIGKIYIKQQEEQLFYTLITPKGNLVENIPINSLNVPEPLTQQSLYKLKGCIFEKVSKAHTNTDCEYFLDKFALDKLITLCRSLDVEDPAFQKVAIKVIKKFNESLTDEAMVNLVKNEIESIQNLLANISSIFLSLKPTKHYSPYIQKEINGLKGKIIYRMCINESLAHQLLSMPVPFFSIPNIVTSIENPIDKVKIIAQKYLMCGEKEDKFLGLLISQTWCKKANDINYETKNNNKHEVSSFNLI